jgi:hypothetical protein
MGEIAKRPDGALTGGDIVAAVVDTLRVYDVPMTGRAKGMIGKQAKELLADGFPPETILAASVLAVRRGQPHVAHFIAQDIALMQAGQHLSRAEYQKELESAKQSLDASKQAHLERLNRAMGRGTT